MSQKIYCENVKQWTFTCEWCTKTTNHTWQNPLNSGIYSFMDSLIRAEKEKLNLYRNISILTSICEKCYGSTVWIAEKNLKFVSKNNSSKIFENINKDFLYKKFYPSNGNFNIEPNYDMDDDCKSLFKEALSILDNSPKASTVLLRVVLEKQLRLIFPNLKNKMLGSILKDKDVENKLGEKLISQLKKIKNFCNQGAHSDIMSFDKIKKEQVKNVFEIINLIIDKLVSYDKKLDKLSSNF